MSERASVINMLDFFSIYFILPLILCSALGTKSRMSRPMLVARNALLASELRVK